MTGRISLIALIAMTGLLSGCGPRNTFQPPPPSMVTVAPPTIQDITVYHKFPGRTEAVDSIELRARVQGYLETLSFKDGQHVEAGDTLMVIEQAPFQALLQSAEAQLTQAKASQSLAQASLERKKRAFANQAVSELDVLSAEADVEVAKGDIQAAEAAVQTATLNLSYATIKAPISGMISRHYVSEGNLVGGGEATLLALLVSENPVYCYFSVDERTLIFFAKKLKDIDPADVPDSEKMKVKMELAEGSIYPVEGVVDYVDNTFDPETGTLNVRARFENPSKVLRGGMFGKIMLPLDFKQAMLVPESAIQRDMVGSYVLVVNAKNKVESRYLKLGPVYENQRVIDSGLKANEQVVVEGLQRARVGVEVRTETKPNTTPAPAAAPAAAEKES
jgi:RND family efflux transporter MFP subunit